MACPLTNAGTREDGQSREDEWGALLCDGSRIVALTDLHRISSWRGARGESRCRGRPTKDRWWRKWEIVVWDEPIGAGKQPRTRWHSNTAYGSERHAGARNELAKHQDAVKA